MKPLGALLADSDDQVDKMVTIMTECSGNTVEESFALLQYLRKGCEEK